MSALPMTRLLAFFSLSLALLLPLQAQYELQDVVYNNKTGSSLKVTAMASTLPSSGYMAVQVNARNGEKIPVNWIFNFTSKDETWRDSANELRSSFSLSCPSGKQRNVEFLVPLVTGFHDYGSRFSLELNITASPPLSSSTHEMNNEISTDWPSILMSSDLFIINASRLDSHLSSSSSGHRADVNFAGSFSPESLSSNWQSYLGYDTMMLTSAEWQLISPGAKTAILKWNRLGGHLIIYGTTKQVVLPSLGIPSEGGSALETSRSWGTVTTLPLPTSSNLDPVETVNLVDTRKPTQFENHLEEFSSKSWPLQTFFGERSFNPIFFILILLAFAIIVGPVNLFIFAKSGQRHRLFVTTPIISLSASLLLLIVIFLQDGFGGKGHRLAFIEIRPDENTAFMQQEQIARTGVLFATTFETDAHSHVSPLALRASRWTRITDDNQGGGARYRVANTDNNQTKLSGDWFKARSEYGHLITSVQATRSRLELLSSDGPPTLTSTFDYPLSKIYYIDQNGEHWESTQELSSGGKVQLSKISEKDFKVFLGQQNKLLHKNAQNRLKSLSQRKGHFIALSQEAPLIESLSSLKWPESRAIITGPIVSP